MEIKSKDIQFIEGTTHYLISAPHGHIHRRPSLSFGDYKQEEPYTDEICKEIVEGTSSNGIIMIKDSEYDPNFHELDSNEYKSLVKEIVKEKKIQKFIDIHGSREDFPYDITIFYKSRFSKSKNLAYSMLEVLDKGKLKGISVGILRFPEDKFETLSEFVAEKLKIPAIQMEIAPYIREDEKLREYLIENFITGLVS